jgi:hypothetical protein
MDNDVNFLMIVISTLNFRGMILHVCDSLCWKSSVEILHMEMLAYK